MRADTAAPLAATGAGCPAGPVESDSSDSAPNQKQQHVKPSVYFVCLFVGDSADITRVTWHRAEGNSSRQLWLRSRRRRCPSCCWTKPSSIRQDRESNSLPDKSNRRILSLSLDRAAEFSPDPNTEEETNHQLRSVRSQELLTESKMFGSTFKNEDDTALINLLVFLQYPTYTDVEL